MPNRLRFNQFFIRPIEVFLRTESSSGILLFFSAVIAMLWANSRWTDSYTFILHLDILGLSLQHWINDGLMALFFFVIGMEIKKEMIAGELSSMKKASLPVAAALGGMVAPALIYIYFNPTQPNMNGWGIPMATDIAFALGILTLFGRLVPLSLKVFLLALAIVDDLGAILVIALFYTEEIRLTGIAVSASMLGVILLCQKFHFRSYYLYSFLGLITWMATLYSGVHATIAGVLLGFLTPYAFRAVDSDVRTYSPLEDLVHKLHPIVGFFIMPIFALANAGIVLKGIDINSLIQHPIYKGVFFGLVLGKPVGILLFSYLSVLFGLSMVPTGLTWRHLLGASLLGGIGFTMSLFISGLSLSHELELFSKVGIIFSSVLASVLGCIVLAVTLIKRKSIL